MKVGDIFTQVSGPEMKDVGTEIGKSYKISEIFCGNVHFEGVECCYTHDFISEHFVPQKISKGKKMDSIDYSKYHFFAKPVIEGNVKVYRYMIVMCGNRVVSTNHYSREDSALRGARRFIKAIIENGGAL